MRKVPVIALFVVLALVASTAVAPRAGALPGHAYETEYYNYNSYWPDGYEIWPDCDGVYSSGGDRTPHDGELKEYFVFNCSTMVMESHQWYRYSEIDCPGYTPGWYPVSDAEAYYHYSIWPC